MTARVFISYRSSDGTDKATALSRDLDSLFGQHQIFLDKEDLPAGSRWRDEIHRALGSGPILLVLVTPNYLGARDAQGRRLIEHADDPVRSELEAGVEAGAHVIPLLCDGVAHTPRREELPPPFDQLAERTWRRLRAYDWRHDVGRLAEDLRHLGLVAREGAPPVPSRPLGLLDAGDTTSHPSSLRRPLLVGGALLVLGGAGVGAWLWEKKRRASIAGRWRFTIGARGANTSRDGEVVMIDMEQKGNDLSFKSSALDVEHARDWQNHRDHWKQRHGKELKRIFYTGEGKLLESEDDRIIESDRPGGPPRVEPDLPGGPRRVVLTVRVEVPDGPEPIDRGTLRASIDPEGKRMRGGRLWVNSERAERVVDLRREP
ncbi:MAG TPA: toll/interleukin-1 receptor domain-containing protein [Caldimonas sp.]|nr:toll/interleukin-1 receptor domain-containing protein [Caldimonas sp.]HEX2540636.1 toll/interleukin-1 receptor domain-containing protein [Caldimonas sp.]